MSDTHVGTGLWLERGMAERIRQYKAKTGVSQTEQIHRALECWFAMVKAEEERVAIRRDLEQFKPPVIDDAGYETTRS